ncbi:MFS transporter [Sphaerisporangium sp. TRM90804]|uniref:MFS transporter n=1 Tax=Sphaerisporangium sp. TRM90804 TaxID=3031113 RepID=UPI00244A459E|nr:MFS transporter [Sphaerisporangium sp. TRM90804]MDH2427976.1 MFS transporter [Sphaerisporangium sp. TRM90804]
MSVQADQPLVHPLRQPPFFRLWAASFFTEVTRWSLLIALPLYALSVTGSALITSTVAMLGLLPSLVLTPVAGIFADRWNPATFMAWLAIVRAVLLLPLLLVHDERQLWIMYLVVAAEAGLTAMFESVKNALLPTLVAREQLVTANATISLNTNLGRLVGSPLGGFTLTLAGIGGVVVTAVVPLVLTTLLVVTMKVGRAVKPPEQQPTAFWRESVAGLRTVWATARLRAAAVIIALMSVAQGMFVILFLVFVTDLLGGGESEAGVLRGVQAVGGLLGGALAGLIARKLNVHGFVSYGLLVFGFISIAIWNSALLTTALWVYVGLFTMAGAPGVWVMAGWLSIVQRATPDGLLGRVMSSLLALSDGLQALGMLLAGLLIGAMPIVALLNLQAALLLLAGVLAWRMLGGDPGTDAAAPVSESASSAHMP